MGFHLNPVVLGDYRHIANEPLHIYKAKVSIEIYIAALPYTADIYNADIHLPMSPSDILQSCKTIQSWSPEHHQNDACDLLGKLQNERQTCNFNLDRMSCNKTTLQVR